MDNRKIIIRKSLRKQRNNSKRNNIKNRKTRRNSRNKMSNNIKNNISKDASGLFDNRTDKLYKKAAKIINLWKTSDNFEQNFVYEVSSNNYKKKSLTTSSLFKNSIERVKKLNNKKTYREDFDENKQLDYGINYYDILTRIEGEIIDYIKNSKYYKSNKKNIINIGLESYDKFKGLSLIQKVEFFADLANIHFDKMHEHLHNTTIETKVITYLSLTQGELGKTPQEIKEGLTKIEKIRTGLSGLNRNTGTTSSLDIETFEKLNTPRIDSSVDDDTLQERLKLSNPSISSPSYNSGTISSPSYSSDDNSFNRLGISLSTSGGKPSMDFETIKDLALNRIFEPINLDSIFKKNKLHANKEFLKKSYIDNHGIDFLLYNDPISVTTKVNTIFWRGYISLRESRKFLLAALIKNEDGSDWENLLKNKISDIHQTVNEKIMKTQNDNKFNKGYSTNLDLGLNLTF